MADSIYTYGGTTDVGYNREINEDAMDFVELDGDVLLSVIADGMGSKPSDLQPATIVIHELVETVKTFYNDDKELFLSNPSLMLKEAVRVANRVVGAFKVANEEMYSGFGVCLTCCLNYGENRFCFVHCGNTRLHLIRMSPDGGVIIRQLTKDHTKAMELLENGIITSDDYYVHPDRATYTSGIGMYPDPVLHVFDGKLKPGDLLLFTTDGIHYAVRPEAMADIVLQAGDWQASTRTLIEGAKMQKMADNMTALVVFLGNVQTK